MPISVKYVVHGYLRCILSSVSTQKIIRKNICASWCDAFQDMSFVYAIRIRMFTKMQTFANLLSLLMFFWVFMTFTKKLSLFLSFFSSATLTPLLFINSSASDFSS